MDVAEYKALTAKAKPNKFRAVKTTVDGIEFPSKLEARHYGELKIRELLGEISNLKIQPVYPIVIRGQSICRIIMDFSHDEAGKCIATDCKGKDTPVSRLKRRIFRAMHPEIELRIVRSAR